MNINEFIDGLKRDKARGELAPHQIILLISLSSLYMENNSSTIDIEELLSTFSKIWKENQDKFKTKNCNLGMPLKVFVNKCFLEIDTKEDINDFRNKTELHNKVSNIKISSLLISLLKNPKLSEYLKSRITI